ncbi:short-chain dehydrogenase, putative [Talaromyces stipitatus ATCC 10500]|uniref:Short-chain dehydrogenase, putative n=1 Tax=Talaromyces stipitatus (strain ATCC 10500 / CBS 375.48 / QM 6759 / NRRL 1006) TaxID=441959 RepID=B8MRH0_TALSN|nr:short-chain dehydrogenase, putative [Talaromyces stipitatus ATCC 10500]EED13107.1 short-chain dehydrogenase, putative [Talaromyces stipitatus ATCC 10500]
MVQFDGPFGKIGPGYLYRGARDPPAEPTQSFHGKTVLVTGCNTGVGYQAALKIAALNPKRLILGTRTLAKGEATRDKILAQTPSLSRSVIDIFEIEYTSFRSVIGFAEAIKDSTSALDCVLLSAGLINPSYVATSEDGVGTWDMAIKVNVLSTALLAIELLPLLRRTSGSILEFVGSTGYCNVTSQQIRPVLDRTTNSMSTEDVDALKFFNDEKRWNPEGSYCEAKLLLMFVLQGLVESLGGSQGRLSPLKGEIQRDSGPIILACCPNQTKTDLGRNFPVGMKVFMFFWNSVFARTAEQGSRTLVSGLTLGEEANGRMWSNDRFDDRSPNITASEWEGLQKVVWKEIVQVLKGYKPDLAI